MKKLLLSFSLLAVLVMVQNTAGAQSWRWGVSGGGNSNTAAGGGTEQVIDMATDPNGNIYVLSVAGQGYTTGTGPLNVDGHTMTSYGGADIMLTSVRCDGTYRWSKLMGGASLDVPIAVKTDTLGGVYVAGIFGTHYVNIHLDTDTTWATGSSYKSLFIAKYDTAGTYQWLRMPEADTAGNASMSNDRILDMDVDGGGNIFLMTALLPGAYAGGSYVVTTPKSVQLLKYNSSGTFLSGTPMQISYSAIGDGALHMKKDFSLDRYYVTGILDYAPGLTFNGNSITSTFFIGAFNNVGNLLWYRQNTYNSFALTPRASVDANHNIYITGTSQQGDTFNSYAVTNIITTLTYQLPLTVKLDTSGHNVWAVNGSTHADDAGTGVIVNGSEVAITGNYAGKLSFPGSPLLNNMTGLYDIFLARFNLTAGGYTGVDTIASGPGFNEFPTAITAGKHSNIYVGGTYYGNMYIGGDTLNNSGGDNDFWFAKFGYDNCGCTITPTANFTFSGTAPVSFTFTGTTPADSVVWDFGDGNHATATNPTHTYAGGGSYNVCVTVYTPCGSNTYCQTITIPTTGINSVGALANVAVYPNPVSGQLFIDKAAAGTHIQLTNLIGQTVYSGTVTGNRQTISTAKLPAGTYLLQLTGTDGNRAVYKIVKE